MLDTAANFVIKLNILVKLCTAANLVFKLNSKCTSANVILKLMNMPVKSNTAANYVLMHSNILGKLRLQYSQTRSQAHQLHGEA